MNCKVSFISYSKNYKNKNEKKKGKERKKQEAQHHTK